jgi:hypothetical protein
MTEENKPKEVGVPKQYTCRLCGHGPYTPSIMFNFYQDDVDGLGTGLCESCIMNVSFATKGPVSITEEQRVNLCKGGQGADACRYLVFTEGFKCAKGSSIQSTIENRAGSMLAKGCYCLGPPNFKKIG